MYKTYLLVLILPVLFGACSPTKQHTQQYTPDDPALYHEIARMDSLFFEAYNTCDKNLERYGSFYSEDIEFYHDQGGLMTSKQDIIDGTRKFVCGKVTRELVKGSIEVYPIKDFGAIEIGFHKFHNNQEPVGTPSKAGRFVIIWKREGEAWQIKRVVSLH